MSHDDDYDKEFEDALKQLEKHHIKLAVENLPYETREGGYQFVYGPEVNIADLRDEVFENIPDSEWDAFAAKIQDYGPWYQEIQEDPPPDVLYTKGVE